MATVALEAYVFAWPLAHWRVRSTDVQSLVNQSPPLYLLPRGPRCPAEPPKIGAAPS